jgi:hypothetical protein
VSQFLVSFIAASSGRLCAHLNNTELFYFLVLHPAERNITIFNENISVRNQTMRVLFITTYTALHVSAHMQAIFKCYPTIFQKPSY